MRWIAVALVVVSCIGARYLSKDLATLDLGKVEVEKLNVSTPQTLGVTDTALSFTGTDFTTALSGDRYMFLCLGNYWRADGLLRCSRLVVSDFSTVIDSIKTSAGGGSLAVYVGANVYYITK